MLLPESHLDIYTVSYTRKDATVTSILTTSTSRMETEYYSKTLVLTYQTTWCHNPKDDNMNCH